MKTILLTILLTLSFGFNSLLDAQDRWEYVCTKDGTICYYDKESITYYSNYIDVWIKITYTNKSSSMLNFERFYCGSRKVTIMETIIHYIDSDFPLYDFEWETYNIRPDTIQEYIYYTICK